MSFDVSIFVRFKMSMTDRATNFEHEFALGKFVPTCREPAVLHVIAIKPWQNSARDRLSEFACFEASTPNFNDANALMNCELESWRVCKK